MRAKVEYKKLSKSWKNSQLQIGISGVEELKGLKEKTNNGISGGHRL